jgi:hypothetical protein
MIAEAFTDSLSNIQVTQSGIISRILSDDTAGDRHQRIIVRLSNNQTLLIAHNIDLSPRVPNPVVGKVLGFSGEYEWNKDGGVIHWTHKDPQGKHSTGWLEYEGMRYSSFDSSLSITFRNSLISFRKNDFANNPMYGSENKMVNISGRVISCGLLEYHAGLIIIKGQQHLHTCLNFVK